MIKKYEIIFSGEQLLYNFYFLFGKMGINNFMECKSIDIFIHTCDNLTDISKKVVKFEDNLKFTDVKLPFKITFYVLQIFQEK